MILFFHPVRPKSPFVEDSRRILPTDLTAPDLGSNNSSDLIWKEQPKQAWENPFLPKERVFQNTSPSRLAAFFHSWHSFPADLFLLSVWVGLALFFPKRSFQSFLPGRVSRVKVLSAHTSQNSMRTLVQSHLTSRLTFKFARKTFFGEWLTPSLSPFRIQPQAVTIYSLQIAFLSLI